MSIPKGFILYKSARYRESLPINIKSGYYSDKVLSSSSTQKGYKTSQNCHFRYQKKFTQEIQFQFKENSLKEIETIRRFSKSQNVKTCRIKLAFSSKLSKKLKEFKEIMTEIIPILFKTLKNLRDVTINPSSELLKTSRASNSLLFARNLESLTLLGLNYSASSNSSQPFMKTIKLASQRRYWPHFKSLKIHFLIQKFYHSFPTENLKRILESLQTLEHYDTIYKCSTFKLALPNIKRLDSEQTKLLSKIAQMTVDSLANIEIFNFRSLSEILTIFKSSKSLKGLSIKSRYGYKSLLKPDLSPLSKIPTFQELKFNIDSGSPFFDDFLSQVQTMVNLTALSIHFSGVGDLQKEFKLNISSLVELKSLEIEIVCQDYTVPFGPSNSLWLEEVFLAIGKMKKLENLSFRIAGLYCKSLCHVFKVLGQSLSELKDLSKVSLHIMKTSSRRSDGIHSLCLAVSKDLKIQDLDLQVLEDDYEDYEENEDYYDSDAESFYLLIDVIANSFPVLSRLSLGVGKFDLTQEANKIIPKAIARMKSLDHVTLLFAAKRGHPVDLELLQKEIQKRIPIDIKPLVFLPRG